MADGKVGPVTNGLPLLRTAASRAGNGLLLLRAPASRVGNGLLLLLIAVAGAVNGLFLDRIQVWRWALFVIIPLVAYLQGRHLPVRRDWALLATVAAPMTVWLPADLPTVIGGLLSLGIFVTLPWLAGRFRRQQAELIKAGHERVQHLERERHLVAEHARLRERARIAADMHDALGHELALIALRAGALELAPDLTDRGRAAAAELRESAVSASDRLRHTVTGLRAEPAVEELVDRARDAGMTIRLHQAGDLGSAAGGTHRVVREALTNAARHAPGSAVDVRLERSGDTVTVTVRNPVVEPAQRSESGSGIAGLRDHLAAGGGTLRVADEEGVFTVTAHLPAR
ncbi:MAG TPA: histidine kinase [Actinoplanes sp.]|nr:histidine kinase [Actinoplanes sp.]